MIILDEIVLSRQIEYEANNFNVSEPSQEYNEDRTNNQAQTNLVPF